MTTHEQIADDVARKLIEQNAIASAWARLSRKQRDDVVRLMGAIAHLRDRGGGVGCLNGPARRKTESILHAAGIIEFYEYIPPDWMRGLSYLRLTTFGLRVALHGARDRPGFDVERVNIDVVLQQYAEITAKFPARAADQERSAWTR